MQAFPFFPITRVDKTLRHQSDVGKDSWQLGSSSSAETNMQLSRGILLYMSKTTEAPPEDHPKMMHQVTVVEVVFSLRQTYGSRLLLQVCTLLYYVQ